MGVTFEQECTCLDCGRTYIDTGIDRDGSCICCYEGHTAGPTTDEADGSDGRAHVMVTRCGDCGVQMMPAGLDEDGRMTWEVA